MYKRKNKKSIMSNIDEMSASSIFPFDLDPDTLVKTSRHPELFNRFMNLMSSNNVSYYLDLSYWDPKSPCSEAARTFIKELTDLEKIVYGING